MSDSAQRPPEPASMLEQFRDLATELVLFCLSAIAGLAALLVLTWLGLLPEDPALSAIISGPIVIGTAGANYLVLERTLMGEAEPPTLTVIGGRPRAGLGTGLLIAAAAMVIATTGSIMIGLVQKLVFSAEVEEQELIVELVERGDPLELTVLAVSAVILAPITEELLFRHMLFRRLAERVGPIAAWTLPPLLFGLSHWNFVGLVIYGWLAIVFAMAYALTGRLWVAILVHAGHNAFALAMLLQAPEALP